MQMLVDTLPPLTGRDFLRVEDLSTEEMVAVLDLADELKAMQGARIPHALLPGRTLGLIFQKASTRTRVSFEVGMYQLGGSAVHLSAAEMQLGRGEPIRDTGIVLGRYLDAIAAARRRVWLANAYFYPPPVLRDALLDAGRRGVEVKIIVPGVSDMPFIRAAARAQYRRWMAAGLELWEYQGVVMHSKYALVDDDWCLVGTFNANLASVAFAIEVAVVSHDRTDASDAEAQMLKDLALSRRVDEAWLQRVGVWRRFWNNVASLVMRSANVLLPRQPAALPEGKATERASG